eukprot:scaffold35983_cov150-Skeletonema_dohrnii-CCMP3373.AAC.1
MDAYSEAIMNMCYNSGSGCTSSTCNILSQPFLFLICGTLLSLMCLLVLLRNISNMVNEDGEEGGCGSGVSTDIGKAGGIGIGIGIDMMSCCASCGIAEVDDIKFMTCDANCKLIRYCSVACQRDHRPQHKEDRKKRVDELRDGILFAQPESSHLGDCPICFLPLALDASKCVMMMTCCSKLICNGCSYANETRELSESLKRKCSFCRHPVPTTKAEIDANTMKRVDANDPVATGFEGIRRYNEGDFRSAFEYLTKAARLGNASAHYRLSVMYWEGKGVEKDEKMADYHAEEAAIAGHPSARFNLGCIEWNDGSKERAVKHFIIAANLGYDKSVETLKREYAK